MRERERESWRERKQERESWRESKRERVRRQQLDPDCRRQVNRAIYRTWRKRKRFVRFQALKDACASGRAPPFQSKGGHVNWGRLFGNVSPAEALSYHYSAMFDFDSLEEAAQESALRQSVMQSWHSRPVGTHEFVCDLPRLRRALKRLYLGKSSPDGLTAEILRQLPDDELSKMAAAIQEMFRSLSFEASWTVITASCIPKKAVTRSLSVMCPISGLCHFRKLLGYIWMDAPPPLRWRAPQAGFVRGRQPAEGAFVLTRVAELAKEWASPVNVGQLDLRQAFDKIKHSAVIGALREKQVPSQLIAVLVAWWSKSEMSVRLQSVSSHRQIRVQRGVPQGAPESPLVFVMTSDCALGRLQENGHRQTLVGVLTHPLVLCWYTVSLTQMMFWFLRGPDRLSRIWSVTAEWNLETSVSKLPWTKRLSGPVR